MSESTPPRSNPPWASDPATRKSAADSDLRHTFERVVAELLKKGIDAGRGSIGRVNESVSPKDIAAGLLAQIGDLRSGIVRAVAHEVSSFLREANIAAEIRNVLDGLHVDAKVELHYDGGAETQRKPRTKTGARAQRS